MSSEQEELLSIEQATDHNIKMGEALNRLHKNEDFQTLIVEGYLKDKVQASVSLLAVPQIKQSGGRPDIMEDLVAASNLSYFFIMVENAYEAAVDPILTDQELSDREEAERGTH